MAGLTFGRVALCRHPVELTYFALTTGIRFSLARRAFGSPERQIMDYTLVQHRLIPRLAECFHLFVGGFRMHNIWMDNLPKLTDEKNKRNELCHGLSSSLSAFGTWFLTDTIGEVRRVCGGLGYS